MGLLNREPKPDTDGTVVAQWREENTMLWLTLDPLPGKRTWVMLRCPIPRAQPGMSSEEATRIMADIVQAKIVEAIPSIKFLGSVQPHTIIPDGADRGITFTGRVRYSRTAWARKREGQ